MKIKLFTNEEKLETIHGLYRDKLISKSERDRLNYFNNI